MKVRRLNFDLGEDRDIEFFSLIYEGFMAGASNETKRSLSIARQEARVLDRLDIVSEPRQDLAMLRTLVKREGENIQIELEPQDFDLVMKYLDQSPWAPMISRKVRDLDDWLRSIPLVDKE